MKKRITKPQRTSTLQQTSCANTRNTAPESGSRKSKRLQLLHFIEGLTISKGVKTIGLLLLIWVAKLYVPAYAKSFSEPAHVDSKTSDHPKDRMVIHIELERKR